MAEMKHTPGPWSLSEKYHSVNVRAVDGPYVADCNASAAIGWETKQANARLIAAAPDMKAALLPLLEAVDEEIEQRKSSGNDEYWQGLQALSDARHAAIAKAEGR